MGEGQQIREVGGETGQESRSSLDWIFDDNSVEPASIGSNWNFGATLLPASQDTEILLAQTIEPEYQDRGNRHKSLLERIDELYNSDPVTEYPARPSDQPAVRPADQAVERPAGAGQDKPGEIKEKVAEVDFNSMNKELLGSVYYEQINLKNLPNGVGIAHWADDLGHYFYFVKQEGAAAGTEVPSDRFYYSPLANSMTVFDSSGARLGEQNLQQERERVDQAYAQHTGRAHKAYEAYERRLAPPAFGRTSTTIDFVNGMAGHADKLNDQQIKRLERMIEDSDNPWLRIHLANAYVIRAFAGLRGQAIEALSNPALLRLDKQETLDNLDRAIEVSSGVKLHSSKALTDQGMNPPSNVFLPQIPLYHPRSMMPFMFGPPPPPPRGQERSRYHETPYYRYWGGSHDYAHYVSAQARILRDLVAILPTALPPARPPRRGDY